jgi:hypothetical protein
MNRTVILCILVGIISQGLSQNQDLPGNTTDRIIEGGNLIIEILKVINGSESDKEKTSRSQEADCATKNFTNVCFVNRSSQIIIVVLRRKDTEQEHELIIANNGKECCYRITPGVYTYSIEQKSAGLVERKIIRKGEILLEVCKDLEIKIK